jgi:hypothetical protein
MSARVGRMGAAGLVALLAIGVALLARPAASWSATSIVAVPTSPHGWTRVTVSPRAARADLDSRLSGGRARRLRPAAIQATGAALQRMRGAADHGVSLRDEAFVLPSPRAARGVVRAWAGAHAGRAAVGHDGRVVIVRGRASVIWREGPRVGLLILRRRASLPRLRAEAIADARFADVALTRRPPRDAWQRVLDGVDHDGSVSRETALAAFSLVYGSLPGVRTPRGRHAPIRSGTLAALWALEHRSQMTAAQRTAVDHRLAIPERRGRSGHVRGSGGDFDFELDPFYQSMAEKWAGVYAGLLGRPLGLRMAVGTSPGLRPSDFADALPLNRFGLWGFGQASICRIRMSFKGTSVPPVDQELIMAHEVFHCYEFTLLGPKVWQLPHDWIIEGLAEWASNTVDPLPFNLADPAGGAGWIAAYLNTPTVPLFDRTYDAVGFWGHLTDFTGVLWPRVSAIVTARGDAAAFKAAGGSEDNTLSSWGSSPFRVSPVAGFTMHSPIEPPGFGELRPGGLHQIISGKVGAPAYTTAQYLVVPTPASQPIVHVAIDGPARILSGATEYTDLRDAWFCVQGRDCTCPPGSDNGVPPTRPLTMPAYLGVTGDPDAGTAGEVTPERLDQFCHKHDSPAPHPRPGPRPDPVACDAGCGLSNGDPHLHAYESDPYEFQAAGEFVLTRSSAPGFDVQVRQQPWEKANDLSINSAIAMRVGRATVELDAGDPMHLLVDHRRRPLPAHSLRLPGGGTVRNIGELSPGDGDAVQIIWPDGSRARVWPIAGFGVSALVAPARSQRGKLSGLLGNVGGRFNADFVGRDGHRYPADVIEGADAASSTTVYGGFGESWRLHQSESLFTYAHGKTTASYTIHGFPFGIYDLAGAPADKRAAAEQLCRQAGVTDPAALADCLIDVLGTGDPRFAHSAAALQFSVKPGTFVSAHPWAKLSMVDDSSTDVVPTLAPDGAAIAVAYRRDAGGAVETADLEPRVSGVALLKRAVPLSGWTSISDPVLTPAPGGGLNLLVAGLHSDDDSDPLNGTNLFAPFSGDALGQPTPLSADVADTLGATAVLAADGNTTMWSSTTGAQLVVHRGTEAIDLTSLSPGLPVTSALGYDASGRLWLAWHSVGSGSADGLYMLALDPATGGAAAGATPLHAPESNSGNVQPRLPLACAATCRVAYTDSRAASTGTLDSWAPGESSPTVVAHDSGIHAVGATYAADGRLWVTWVSGDGNHLLAKLGDARAAGGAAQTLRPPPGRDTPDQTALLASGERLTLVTQWSALETDRSSIWATVVEPL